MTYILLLTSSSLETVSLQWGILCTKVLVVGLVWSSFTSLTKSVTPIMTPGIVSR